jgi:hypothetical protein
MNLYYKRNKNIIYKFNNKLLNENIMVDTVVEELNKYLFDDINEHIIVKYACPNITQFKNGCMKCRGNLRMFTEQEPIVNGELVYSISTEDYELYCDKCRDRYIMCKKCTGDLYDKLSYDSNSEEYRSTLELAQQLNDYSIYYKLHETHENNVHEQLANTPIYLCKLISYDNTMYCKYIINRDFSLKKLKKLLKNKHNAFETIEFGRRNNVLLRFYGNDLNTDNLKNSILKNADPKNNENKDAVDSEDSDSDIDNIKDIDSEDNDSDSEDIDTRINNAIEQNPYKEYMDYSYFWIPDSNIYSVNSAEASTITGPDGGMSHLWRCDNCSSEYDATDL